ncbi:hypothetical protein [Vallitalea sp.]|jgi:hypothetical protein|uniref:hypothetical protein n=1 Tax=Vallitalea sp. TaxID=1882829 RepID=UPI0025EDB946|nr:hypothetical protein [Vallitalea sp.]MCT4686052.1 hypothetical protein [Vallitalea sp.]
MIPKQKFLLVIMLIILVISGCQKQNNSSANNTNTDITEENEGKVIYIECYNKYKDNFDKLTDGVDETNAHEKVPTLYTDDNKKIIEEMGNVISEYDEKLAPYEDYYPMYNDLKESYDRLKKDFAQLEQWNELSYTEQIEIRLSFLLMY